MSATCRLRRATAAAAPLLMMLVLAVPLTATDYRLYVLAGQSNMEGYGTVAELPDSLMGIHEEVRIFHGTRQADGEKPHGLGQWSPLRPGHGAGFSATLDSLRYGTRFGPELGFATRLRERRPKTPIALIKYAKDGTGIDSAAAGDFGCWDPDLRRGSGFNQYDFFLATLRNALAVRDIDGDGTPDRLIPAGIVWMQGESDAAFSEAVAHRYEANLRRLMDLFRAALRVDDLPVVIGRISESGRDEDGIVWTHGDIVRAAQERYTRGDACAALVTHTDRYAYSDPWHYDAAGFIDLGFRMAEAMADLEARCGAGASGPGTRDE